MKAPIQIPRWVLAVKYALFTLLGAAVYATDPPSFESAYDAWYTPIWALLVCVAGVLAFAGSFASAGIEKWGATALFVLMGVYAFAPIMLVIAGDMDRLAYSVIAVTLSLLPYARAVQLWNQGARDA